jgi:hypothetical protein
MRTRTVVLRQGHSPLGCLASDDDRRMIQLLEDSVARGFSRSRIQSLDDSGAGRFECKRNRFKCDLVFSLGLAVGAAYF